jgi:hypothetical protein
VSHLVTSDEGTLQMRGASSNGASQGALLHALCLHKCLNEVDEYYWIVCASFISC